jgi:hypothetical protein
MARTHKSSAADDAPINNECFTPRFASAWAALTYALCALSLSYPALAGQFLVNERSDQYLAGYAFRDYAAQFFKSTGGFPQWNPYLFNGMPYVAAMHGDIFYPTFLLRLILPTDVAMTWGMILHFFLAGLFTFWFLRHAAKLSFFAALVGGVAYMMGGFLSSLLSAGHDGKLFVNALLPLTLLVITWGVRDGKKWAWGVLSLVVGLVILTPHPQLMQYLLLTAGFWALFLAYGGTGSGKLTGGEAVQRLGLALMAVVLGLAIGAIQYLPVREYVSWSPRSGGKDWAWVTSYSFPIEELINTYLPQFSGILDNYWGRNGIHFHSEYVGAAVLVLATAAFGGWAGARKRFFWFWVGTALVSLLWALGGSTPFFTLVYYIVPGTKFMRAPSTIFYVTTFAIAVLAALGTEKLLAGMLTPKFAYGWLIGAGIVTVFAFVGGFTAMAQAALQIPQFADRIDANAGAVKLGALRSFIFVAMVAIAILLLSMKKITPTLAGWALAAICAVDLWSIERFYWQFLPPAKQIFASDATIDYIKKLPQPARVISFPVTQRGQSDPFLNDDALMANGVRQTLLGYHGNELGRFQQFDGKDRGYDQIGNPTFWAMTNSQYMLIDSTVSPMAGATKVVGPVKNAYGSNVSLFKLPGEQPYAWVAPAIVKFPDSSVLDATRAPTFPVRAVAIFDTSSKVAAQQLAKLPEPLMMTATVDKYEPGHVTLTLSEPAPKGSALVVAENFYPGWKATIDGKPATVERADLVLMGVPLPEGAKRVELTFKSDTYETGKMVTIVAILASIILAVGGAALGRRASTGNGEAARA